MKTRCLVTAILISILAYSQADKSETHNLVKRQVLRPGNERTFPLSRSRQFPPPEELESSEYVNSEDEEEEVRRPPGPPFRGRQDQRPPAEDDYADEFAYTAAPQQTTPAPQKSTARTFVFNNRFAARPRFGSQSSSTATTSRPTTASTSRPRAAVATPAQSQRFDVVANILNKTPPPRASERSISISRTANSVPERKPAETSSEPTIRRTNNSNRQRTRNRFRPRTSSTTTTTTTTTEQPLEEYYYYYEDEEEPQKNAPIATTTSTTTTTTTTTTKKPSLPRRVSIRARVPSGRSQTTAKPAIKFDPESQFAPPPEEPVEVLAQPSSTKKFTTTSTEASPLLGGIPAHLRSRYKPRKDGRFIDFLRDPNRPRELKGFDLTDYPFYITVPEDIDFECDNKKDGYYASVPHRCQLFHYCFAGARYDFLCANYTLYDQTTFTCRFANNVDCEASESFYYRNDDLWKETTTPAPETTTPKKRRTTPKDDYEDEDYYEDDYDEEEEERRRPPKRRRNRRKNRRKPSE